MKKVLIIYYTQTGQMKTIIDSMFGSMINHPDIEVDFEELKPATPYPYPWSSKVFFDTFPECVKEIPCEMQPAKMDENKDYDLIIVAYQPWYLSPSIPVSSFLQSQKAKTLFKGKKVVTVIGCRNMWLQGQEKMKRQLKKLDARLTGNIVLFDRNYNLISVYTILRWMLYGIKGNAGVSKRDIDYAGVYGDYVEQCLTRDMEIQQNKLADAEAVEITSNLIGLEKTATKLFHLFAQFVLAKGEPGNPARRFRVKLFGFYLLLGIVILSPLTTAIYYLTSIFKLKQIRKDIVYFKGVALEASEN